MKLSKALEILELNIKLAGSKMPPDTLQAVKLAIEALERIQVGRNNPGTHWNDLLPDEHPET